MPAFYSRLLRDGKIAIHRNTTAKSLLCRSLKPTHWNVTQWTWRLRIWKSSLEFNIQMFIKGALCVQHPPRPPSQVQRRSRNTDIVCRVSIPSQSSSAFAKEARKIVAFHARCCVLISLVTRRTGTFPSHASLLNSSLLDFDRTESFDA